MNKFRRFTKNRFFIGSGLLLLLLSLLVPVCEAGQWSEADPLTVQDSVSLHAHLLKQTNDVSHTEISVHHCCTDVGAQLVPISVALLSVSIVVADVDDALYELLPLDRTLVVTAKILSSHHFKFNASGLPRYLVTQRLRV